MKFDGGKVDFGTAEYIAPEVWKKGPYTNAIDVWGAACVLYAMVYGYLPFQNQDVRKAPFDFKPDEDQRRKDVMKERNDGNLDKKNKYLQKLIMKGQYQENDKFSPYLSDLLAQMFKVDPEERITIGSILNHPWVLNGERELKIIQTIPPNELGQQILFKEAEKKYI